MHFPRCWRAFAILAGLALLPPLPASAQVARADIEAAVKDYITSHPDEVGEILKDYLVKNPDVLRGVFIEMMRRRLQANAARPPAAATAAPDRSAAVKSNASELFTSPHQVTLGNPNGDVTLVEFFDYSCGYCKRALPDVLALIQDDPKLKVVLKEFPILGPGSSDAARVAIAARIQDPGGEKVLAFHRALLGSAGAATRDKALAAARDQGFDMTRLEQDMASDEVKATLEEDFKLAKALGITGTPSFVIGDAMTIGAVGLPALRAQVDQARARHVE